jgi:hypothetical protein
MKTLFHRLLCFLKLRDEFDYVPPFAPEVNHPYEQDERLRCCRHCGGGKRHAIHREPFDERRYAEIVALHVQEANRDALSVWEQAQREKSA